MRRPPANAYCVAVGLVGSALLLLAAFSKMRQPVAAIASGLGSFSDVFWLIVAVIECVLAFVIVLNLRRRVTFACLAVLYLLFAAISGYSALYETNCGCFADDFTGWKLFAIDLMIAFASFGVLLSKSLEHASAGAVRVRLPVAVGLGTMAVSMCLVVACVLSGRASVVGLSRLQVVGVSCGSPASLATQTCNITVSNPSNRIIRVVGAIGTCGVQITQSPVYAFSPGDEEIIMLKLPSELSSQKPAGIQFFIQDSDGLKVDYLPLDRVRF